MEKLFERINRFKVNDFKKAVTINMEGNADELFNKLEIAAQSNKFIVINRCLTDYGPAQIVLRFLDRYKSIIDFFYTDLRIAHGRMYVKLKSLALEQAGAEYTELEQYYKEDYYMSDCGGYEVFQKSGGMSMELRLQDVFHLIAPEPEDRILDVGCGRGELSFAMANVCSEVGGVDYSKDAIAIANRTYGGKLNNLHFLQADVLTLTNMDRYNKVIMADVVEHIEQEMLERLFEKISMSMNQSGIVVIHTAPNKDFYDYYYPEMRKKAAETGCFLPENPRSYHEKLMHINEQTPDSLKRTLDKYFKYCKVWTGSVMEIDENKTFEESCRENQIFAYACNDEERLKKVVWELTKRPDFEQCDIIIKGRDLEARCGEEFVNLEVVIINQGKEHLTSRRKYPINLAYHVYDDEGNLLVFDGERTPIECEIRQNERRKLVMNIKIPKRDEGGRQYKICLTMVAEGCFWFDAESKNCSFITLSVLERDS